MGELRNKWSVRHNVHVCECVYYNHLMKRHEKAYFNPYDYYFCADHRGHSMTISHSEFINFAQTIVEVPHTYQKI